MPKKQPNILWLMTDQQSASMMSCAGNPHIRTPNMDLLAETGVRFTNAYCTNPICLPSRFSLLTGLYPGAVGIRNNDVESALPQGKLPAYLTENGLGTLMKRAGYRAVYGGKEHLPATSARELGFDYICSDERDTLADVCASYISGYASQDPFFMVASFINPHDICFLAIADNPVTEEDMHLRRNCPVENITMEAARRMPRGVAEDEFYAKLCPPLPENYEPSWDEPEAISILQAARPFKQMARRNYTERDWLTHRFAYARLTELADRQIGRVLDALIESGRFDDTIIIFTSDHGDMDASHKMEHKSNLYRECCNVPLIVKGLCAQPEGAVSDALVSNGLDILPTILDYAGIPAPKYLPGLSIRGICEREVAGTARGALIVECEYGLAALDKRGKLTQYNVGARAEQFYDFATNPHERFNQIGQLEFSERIERLRAALENH